MLPKLGTHFVIETPWGLKNKRGCSIQFTERLLLTYLFIAVSAWIVSLGMEMNGIDRSTRWLYSNLCFLRWCMILAPTAAFAIYVLFHLLAYFEVGRPSAPYFEDAAPRASDTAPKRRNVEHGGVAGSVSPHNAATSQRQSAEEKSPSVSGEKELLPPAQKRAAVKVKKYTADDATKAALNDF